MMQKGATSGSRVEFVSKDGKRSFIMHKPHPSNIMKKYAMKQILMYLIDNTNLKNRKR